MRKLAVLVLLAPLVAGCGASWRTFRAHGVSVRYPRNWFATARPLTHVTSPVQVLAVASYRLPRGPRGSAGCAPKQALGRLPPRGAFVFAWEFQRKQLGQPRRNFRPRPDHFSLAGRSTNECFGPSYALPFREAGRFFELHVVLGRDASAGTRATVLRILDSFRAGS